MHEYPIIPVAKPRMTQRDKWKVRPCVARYRTFADLVRWYRVQLPTSGAWVVFVLPMPKSWSKTAKQEHDGQPHQQRPDLDNLFKALADALYEDDSVIWDVRKTKVWGYKGRIRIKRHEQVP